MRTLFLTLLIAISSVTFSQEEKTSNGIQIGGFNTWNITSYNRYFIDYSFEKNKTKIYTGPLLGAKVTSNLRGGDRIVSNSIEFKGAHFGLQYSISNLERRFVFCGTSEVILINTKNQGDVNSFAEYTKFFNSILFLGPGLKVNLRRFNISSVLTYGIGYSKFQRKVTNEQIQTYEGLRHDVLFNFSIGYRIK